MKKKLNYNKAKWSNFREHVRREQIFLICFNILLILAMFFVLAVTIIRGS